MAIKQKDSFTNKVEQNRLLYGQEDPSKDFVLDWENNVLPNLLKVYLSADYHLDTFLSSSFKSPKEYKIELSNLWQRVCVLKHFINSRPPKGTFIWKGDAPYNQREDLLGLFSQCKPLIEKGAAVYAADIAYFLFCMGTEVRLASNLPKELQRGFIDLFKDTFMMMSEYFSKKTLENILKKYQFIPCEKALKTTPKPNGYVLQAREPDQVELAFINKDFKDKHLKDLSNMLADKTQIIYGIVFENCRFPELEVEGLSTRLLFQNCTFTNGLYVSGTVKHTVGLFGCRASKPINFDGVQFDKNLYISYSFLSLSMEKVRFNQNAVFKINETVLFGNTSFKKANLCCKIEFSNVAFLDTFSFSDAILGKDCVLEHLAFNNVGNNNVRKSKQSLEDTLRKYNYSSILISLGLTQKDTKKQADEDDKAYEIAYKSGWFNPKQASRLTGKKVGTLTVMRMNDKKKLRRESIPHRTHGRDVKYPVEALEAFVAQDWDKLRELRKKYKYTGQS